MNSPYLGNAARDHFGRGWVVGGFVADPLDIRGTDDVEIKWSTHTAGDRRDTWTTEEPRMTACFLLSGRLRVHLPSNVYDLRESGDYLVFGVGVSHWWEAVADSVVLTVRWTAHQPIAAS